MSSALRLDDRFRRGLYAAFAVLFATGVVWLVADNLKDSDSGEVWQRVAADLLMIHGGAAMAALLLLGALIPVHVQRAWRGHVNRVTGIAMVTANALLIVTAFGLYYSGSDVLRAWTSDLHIAVGLLIPLLIVVHILTGRRRLAARSRQEQR
jgi:small-conductance mechanosensitive channel